MTRNFLKVLVSKGLFLLFSFLGLLIIARSLGAETRGAFAAALIYPQLLISLFEGGMRQATTIFVGKNETSLNKTLSSSLIFALFMGVVGFTTVFMILSEYNADISIVSRLYLSSIVPLTLVINIIQGAFLGFNDISSFNSSTWKQKLFFFVLIIMFYALEYLSLDIVIFVYFASTVFNLLLVLWIFFNKYTFKLSFDSHLLKSMLRIGVFYAISLFLIQLNYKLDILFLSFLSTERAVGIYAVTVQFGDLVWQIPAAIVIVLMSSIASTKRIQSDNISIETIQLITRLTVCVCVFVVLAVFIGLFYFSEQMLGKSFSSLSYVFLWLAPGLVFATVFKTINAYFAGKGKPLVAIYIMFPAVLLNVILNLVLIPLYAEYGAAASSSLSYFITAVLTLFHFNKTKSQRIKDMVCINSSDIRLIITTCKKVMLRGH